MKADSRYDLIMPFIDETSNFVHGFECGCIWEWAQNGKSFNNYIFHTANKLQTEKILTLHGYDFRIELVDNTWSTIFGTNNAELN